MTLYQIRSHNLEFENEFFSNIKKCVRVKSDTLNFLELEKKYGNLELSASDFNQTHLKLPNKPLVHCKMGESGAPRLGLGLRPSQTHKNVGECFF